jgi:hypothetical protein
MGQISPAADAEPRLRISSLTLRRRAARMFITAFLGKLDEKQCARRVIYAPANS